MTGSDRGYYIISRQNAAEEDRIATREDRAKERELMVFKMDAEKERETNKNGCRKGRGDKCIISRRNAARKDWTKESAYAV